MSLVAQIRRGLFQVLGTRGYLSLVSRSYILMTLRGMLRRHYPELFALERFVRPGAYCIDIGANLGYYSVRLSRLAGHTGRVWSIEPVPLFADILSANLGRYALSNVTVMRTALGAEEGTVRMGTPEVEGVFRHGRTHVIEQAENDEIISTTYEVPVAVPDRLFHDLARLDFVKCDVEGYEGVIFPHFAGTLRLHRPAIQVEITGEENRRLLFGLLEPMGYRCFVLDADVLRPVALDMSLGITGHDFYFLPEDHPAIAS